MSFLLSQTSTGFSSAEVLPTNLATIVYLRERNLINQPKTLTASCFASDHKQLRQLTVLNSPFCNTVPERTQKKFLSNDQSI